MKLTKQRAAIIRKVIGEHRIIMHRVTELHERGYILQLCSLNNRGRVPVGKIHEFKHTCRLQVGATSGHLTYAWCVIFDPAPYKKINELNKLYFSGESV